MVQPTSSFAFIGAGNMASAIIHGLLHSGLPADRIQVIERTKARVKHWKNKGIQASTNFNESVRSCDVILFCVKPQAMQEVVRAARPFIGKQSISISIAAGVRLAQIRHWLDLETNTPREIIRCMPNTPSLVGRGVTGVYASESFPAEKKKLVQEILACIGEVVWVARESDLDVVTALSGSGPAYVFQFMQAMISAGTSLGLSDKCAKNLVLHMVGGATHMALAAESNLLELERQIRSAGGTTDAACSVLAAGGFQQTIVEAVYAAYRRSIEIAGTNTT